MKFFYKYPTQQHCITIVIRKKTYDEKFSDKKSSEKCYKEKKSVLWKYFINES